jgi:plasmid maintenance system antidote protein VapI
MERMHNHEFNRWVLEMLKKYNVTQVQLAKSIDMECGYISNIIRGKYKASKKIKYLIINFFKKEYGESYIPLEKIKPITFGEWLDNEMLKHEIGNDMLAEKICVGEAAIIRLREEKLTFKRTQRSEILDILERDYAIDVTEGRELLDKLQNKYYKEMALWICDVMKATEISEVELLKNVGISKSESYLILQGKSIMSHKNAEKLFGFFEQRGIETSEGKEKFKRACEHKEIRKYGV